MNQAKTQVWPEIVENVQLFLCTGFVCGGSLHIYITEVLCFCFEFELLREQSRWFTFYQQRAEKGLLNHDIIYMAATHARHIHGVTDLVIMAVFLDMSGVFI